MIISWYEILNIAGIPDLPSNLDWSLARSVDTYYGQPDVSFSWVNVGHSGGAPLPYSAWEDGVVSQETASTSVWQLTLSPVGGFTPSWKVPTIAGCCVASFLLAVFFFEAMRRRAQYNHLLSTLLPARVIKAISRNPSVPYNESFDHVCLLFVDIVGFTSSLVSAEPAQALLLINTLFDTFDSILSTCPSAMKVETVGDEYFAIFGANKLPGETPQSQALSTARLAHEFLEAAARIRGLTGEPIVLRAGAHCGPIVAGVVGVTNQPHYSPFGITVNIASRMESTGEPGRVHVSAAFVQSLSGGMDPLSPEFVVIPRGTVDVKGVGTMETAWLERGKVRKTLPV